MTARIDDTRAENAGIYFEIASMSKTLFAYCVVSLAKEGAFDLERPLWEYAPECFLSSDPRAGRITAKDVLRHSSGLKNWEKEKKDKTLFFDPGTAFKYSGEGYTYLQNCLQSAFSLSFQALLDTFVNAKLGTHFASTFASIPPLAPFARPYGIEAPYEPMLKENAAYSVYATAQEYEAFLRMLFSDGAAAMAAASIPVNPDISWCMGFGLVLKRYAFQYANNGDFQGFYYVDIPARRVWLRLSNYRYGLMDAVNELDLPDVKCSITAFLKQQYGEDFNSLLPPVSP